jgi:hypothetical protein
MDSKSKLKKRVWKAIKTNAEGKPKKRQKITHFPFSSSVSVLSLAFPKCTRKNAPTHIQGIVFSVTIVTSCIFYFGQPLQSLLQICDTNHRAVNKLAEASGE